MVCADAQGGPEIDLLGFGRRNKIWALAKQWVDDKEGSGGCFSLNSIGDAPLRVTGVQCEDAIRSRHCRGLEIAYYWTQTVAERLVSSPIFHRKGMGGCSEWFGDCSLYLGVR